MKSLDVGLAYRPFDHDTPWHTIFGPLTVAVFVRFTLDRRIATNRADSVSSTRRSSLEWTDRGVRGLMTRNVSLYSSVESRRRKLSSTSTTWSDLPGDAGTSVNSAETCQERGDSVADGTRWSLDTLKRALSSDDDAMHRRGDGCPMTNLTRSSLEDPDE